jgi:hypothetical protein
MAKENKNVDAEGNPQRTPSEYLKRKAPPLSKKGVSNVRQKSLKEEVNPNRKISDPDALKDSLKGMFGKAKKAILGRNMGGSTNKNARDGLAVRGTTKAVYRD